MILELIGAGCFGLVVGWICYRTLRRKADATRLSDLASIVGVIGGGAVTALFKTPELFACYAIGLTIGFFGYLLVGWRSDPKGTGGWMQGAD